ncbi:uncharacterized protein C8Q71DRAFT_752552 [Rhodofomes roseus]|uniref:ZZ-type domain-containing protein n=1 Tax=Rhodofomes roseus TaxID=34475 RepID=A0ABQ8KLC7_9APHY|nr:uncharacterized protein C8Q71DRAFT_752552 [Rhodofomes roseus]KAH9838710.1 hypothetical protein C8Q71DRAFT_752552 [Rhodofomes roseus]
MSPFHILPKRRAKNGTPDSPRDDAQSQAASVSPLSIPGAVGSISSHQSRIRSAGRSTLDPIHEPSSQTASAEGNGAPAQSASVSHSASSVSGTTHHESGDDDHVNEAIDEAAQELRARSPAAKPGSKLGKKIGALVGIGQTANGLVSSLETDSIQNAVNGFFESVPVLVRALDEIAKIHPFISVALLAFKAVYTFEMKRSENDSKVIALYVEMKDMMTVLLELKSIKDPSAVDVEGIAVEGRMQGLIKQIAEDIKRCANVCDVWSKMRSLAKVLKAPFWESNFVDLVNLFAQRRADLQFAMSMHAMRGIDGVSDQLKGISRLMEERTNPEQIIYFIQTYVSQEDQHLYKQVTLRGGAAAVLHDQCALEELTAEGAREPSGEHDGASDLRSLQADLRDPAEAANENLPSFERKLEILQRQIVEDTEKIMVRESDRVIESVTSGPHDRILDKDIYTIWKEMGWRGSVKTRHFVLALRDFYHDRVEESKRKEAASDVAYTSDADAWSLEFISMKWLQSISEAFDDDASGFVTIAEANDFTSSRPTNWSLPRWIAYWAVGWQNTATIYKEKIYKIVDSMFALKPCIHPQNRQMVERYLNHTWEQLMFSTMPLEPLTLLDKVQRRFGDYVVSEETRLKRNLETIRYRVDDLTTLSIVTGPGRIEKYLFPLLYLMLQRDLQILKICRHHIVDERELWDCGDNILTVVNACKTRKQSLGETFSHQGWIPQEQFKSKYCRLFELTDDWKEGRKRLYDAKLAHIHYDESSGTAGEEKSDLSALNHPLKEPYRPEVEQYIAKQYVETDEDRMAQSPIKEILGTWYSLLSKRNPPEWPMGPMFTVEIHVAKRGPYELEAVGSMPDSMRGITFTLGGNAETTAHGETYYTLHLSSTFQAYIVELRGKMSKSPTLIEGVWGGVGKEATHTEVGPFVLTRMTPEVLSCRPAPWKFEQNRIRALWRFALSATRQQVLRSTYSWKFFKQRRTARLRYVEFILRERFGPRLSAEDEVEYQGLIRSLSPADARFYASLAEHQLLQTACVHHGYECDNCSCQIRGSRMVCMTCATRSLDTLDLCSDPRCLASTVTPTQRSDLASPHLPTHDIFQLRKTMYMRERQQYDAQVREALRRSHATLDELDAPDSGPNTSSMVNRKLRCLGCEGGVKWPCWYCVECDDDVFLCVACDIKGGITKNQHKETHTLVRCQARMREEPQLSIEQRMEALETRFGTMHDSLYHRLDGLEAQLSRIQELLESAVSRPMLGPGPRSASHPWT